jgi:ATP-dependent helicase HepA
LLAEIEQGRDKLLEQHSFSADRVESLLESIDRADSQKQDLQDLVLHVFDNGHIETEDAGTGNIIVSPQENCPFSFINNLRDEKATVTFDRKQATVREDLEFISWDHPWIKGIVDDLEASGDAFTSCALFNDSQFKNGQLFVEATYQIKSEGPGRLELNRYLAPQTRHYVISDELKSVSKLIDLEQMKAEYEKISKDMARELIEMKWAEISAAVSLSEKLAAHTSKANIEESVQTLLTQTQQELARYQSLEITSGTYQLEINALKDKAKQAVEFLQNTKPKLMSLTVWVNFHQ